MPTGVGALLFLLGASSLACGECGEPPDESEGEGEGDSEGEGEGEGEGILRVSPSSCDFGTVTVGATAFCAVILSNEGNRELVLGNAVVLDDGAIDVFSVGEVEGEIIPPGAAIVLRVAAVPPATGSFFATIEIYDADQEDRLEEIPVAVTGVPGPTCVARVKSVNGVDVDTTVPNIAPLDDVIVTLDPPEVAPDRSIVGFSWTFLGRPTGSTVMLTTPAAESTGFTFGSRLGLDLAGSYSVRGSVMDDAGQIDECDLDLLAVSSSALYAQLTWDMSVGDLDLHLHRSADDLCSSLDCYALTCAGEGVSWGDPAQSPRMGASDSDGFGPESIAIDAPADGTYRLAVHAKENSQPTTASIRVFTAGQLAIEAAITLSGGDLWRPMDIVCAPGGCSIVEDGALDTLAQYAP